jgi:Calcineurin-like phosphoesterase
MERFFAVGDIHGCVEPLDELLEVWRSNYSDRRLVFLGDYIDRGADPEGARDRRKQRQRRHRVRKKRSAERRPFAGIEIYYDAVARAVAHAV